MDDVEDFLARHVDEIDVVVNTFNGRVPPQKGVVEFVTASERCWRENGRPMNDEEFKKALEAFDDE